MVEDLKAIDFNGVSESLRSGDSSGPYYSFDVSNTWTVTVNYKLAAVDWTQTFFHLNDLVPGDNDNTILLEARDKDLRLLVVGSKGYGYPSKMFDYYGVLSSGTWCQTTVTWDGTAQELSLYQDEVLHAPSGTPINDYSLVMTDSVDKSLWLGENKDTFSREFKGRIHSVAVWDTALSVSQIPTATGASTEDLSSAQHWWRLGLDATTSGLGLDYGNSSTSIDVNQASSQITADDVVDDYPGKPDISIYTYSSNQTNVDFFADAGSPASGDWKIVIEAGVTIGSSSTGTPAAVTGAFPGELTVENSGRIQGKGGDGGVGFAFPATTHYAGGGGGAGTAGGSGGASGGGTGTDGAPGTSEAGGVGGTGGTNPFSHQHSPAGNGAGAGDAFQLDVDVTIDNTNGEIWGGGGGGGGGGFNGVGGAGGAPGNVGSPGTNILAGAAGAAGKAIDQQGNSITWDGGSGSPNVEGAVS